MVYKARLSLCCLSFLGPQAWIHKESRFGFLFPARYPESFSLYELCRWRLLGFRKEEIEKKKEEKKSWAFMEGSEIEESGWVGSPLEAKRSCGQLVATGQTQMDWESWEDSWHLATLWRWVWKQENYVDKNSKRDYTRGRRGLLTIAIYM